MPSSVQAESIAHDYYLFSVRLSVTKWIYRLFSARRRLCCCPAAAVDVALVGVRNLVSRPQIFAEQSCSMGPLLFIKKALGSKKPTPLVLPRNYLEFGYIRFSDDSYGFPVYALQRYFRMMTEALSSYASRLAGVLEPVDRLSRRIRYRLEDWWDDLRYGQGPHTTTIIALLFLILSISVIILLRSMP